MSSLALRNLNKISLNDCGIEHLPPFGKLHSLRDLRLKGMDCIKHLGTEWHGDGETSFPALTTLTIIEMPNLEEWIIPDSVESFPCLQALKIRRCPKVKGLSFLSTLRSLDIYDNSATLVGSITSLTTLTRLELSNFEILDFLPVGLLHHLNALKVLHITKLPIRTLSNMLDNMSTLRASILESLSSLTSLTVENCKKLNPLSGPLQRGAILQHLDIKGCPELKDLPESMQRLSAFEELRISNCEGLYYLPNWFRSLQSLSEINIWECKNLKTLPDCFQSLRSLRELSIKDCPGLEKRCKKPKGQGWPKISHIPMIEINNKTIQYLYH
ncbi:hypothetical protein BUALT_Bualt11G0059800 [Buddleja alternifolia]|uniref:R13L1/DRL21-like LRR repeat region domain-containing protein n=1 Tax=Buddleja alternifolia TaxID=168488 RepID=A0AAV6X051_9LAMI|nr:hypothetical protein BUALT_Bualt11G0059800 [Buddleja alternifolia]